MPYNIGRVFSPEVTAALLRRGEARGGMSGIRRRDPIRRNVDQASVGEEVDPVAIMRERRLAEMAQAEVDRQARLEDRDEREFEFSRDMAMEQLRRQDERDAFERMAAMQPTPPSLRDTLAIRKEARAILESISDVLRRASAVDPNTGKVNPNLQAQANQMAAMLWQQYLALGLPPEEVERAASSLGVSASGPAPRAGAGQGEGITRGASSGAARKPWDSGIPGRPDLAALATQVIPQAADARGQPIPRQAVERVLARLGPGWSFRVARGKLILVSPEGEPLAWEDVGVSPAWAPEPISRGEPSDQGHGAGPPVVDPLLARDLGI